MKNERGGLFCNCTICNKYTQNIWSQSTKNDHNIEDSEFIKDEGVKKSTSKQIKFHDFDKYVRDLTNTPLTTEHKALVAIIIKFMGGSNENDKEILDQDGIRTYPINFSDIFIFA